MAHLDAEARKAYHRAYYHAHKEHMRATNAAYLKANRQRLTAARKGLTKAQYDALVIEQSGRCAICEAPAENLNIDHDHDCCPGSARSCGRCVRGLLCSACNHMLGKAKDNPVTLEAGAAYLRSFAARVVV